MIEPDSKPPSPCIGVCVIGADQLCRGCRRSLDEIARWRDMTGAEQRRVVRELASRVPVDGGVLE